MVFFFMGISFCEVYYFVLVRKKVFIFLFFLDLKIVLFFGISILEI